jgi:hypothetical protein
MASISTGLDYDTGGAKRSTGAKMRSYTADQEGGTDAGDAQESWRKGFSETLTVRDGGLWPDVLADLGAGRMVHLDVWHASVGGPCLSGSGQYGHTMAVLPDCLDDAWLVADPWCRPASWVRVAEAKLRAGAERWGSQVYGGAALESDWPTGGDSRPRDPDVLAIVERVAKRLMSAAFPGHPGQLAETSGPPRILYTVTRPMPLAGGTDMAGPTFTPGATVGVATVKLDGGSSLIATSDGEYHPVAKGYVRNVSDVVTITDGKYKGSPAYLVSIGGGESGLLLASHADYVPRAQLPADTSAIVHAAVRARDETWRTNLSASWPTTETAATAGSSEDDVPTG